MLVMTFCVDHGNDRAMPLMPLPWFLRRAYTRSVLKQQIDDNCHTERQSRLTRNLESVVALEKDRRDRDEDARNFRNKFNYLKTFRDENKKVKLNHLKTFRDENKKVKFNYLKTFRDENKKVKFNHLKTFRDENKKVKFNYLKTFRDENKKGKV